jgi:hypothetical protein
MSWGLLLILVGVALLIPTAYAGKIGAPYAPTRMRVVRKAFDELEIGNNDVVVDLGVGDGSIVIEAARRGAKAYGYELSPIMWAVAWVRTWFVKGKRPTIYFGNFYKKKPEDATVIFAFLMPDNMPRVKQYLRSISFPNGSFMLAYAFPFKDEEPLTVIREDKCAPLYVYDLQKISNS